MTKFTYQMNIIFNKKRLFEFVDNHKTKIFFNK